MGVICIAVLFVISALYPQWISRVGYIRIFKLSLLVTFILTFASAVYLCCSLFITIITTIITTITITTITITTMIIITIITWRDDTSNEGGDGDNDDDSGDRITVYGNQSDISDDIGRRVYCIDH